MNYIHPHGREELLRKVLPTARRMARAAQRRSSFRLELEDLEAIAAGAALEAVRRFDPTRARLLPFVSQRVRWALLAHLRRRWRRLDPGGGLPAGTALRFADLGMRTRAARDAPLDEARGIAGTITPGGDLSNVAMSPHDTPEQALSRRRLGDQLRSALNTLREPARSLMRRHYFEGERLDLAADALGISKHAAYRVHRNAVSALRRHLSHADLER